MDTRQTRLDILINVVPCRKVLVAARDISESYRVTAIGAEAQELLRVKFGL